MILNDGNNNYTSGKIKTSNARSNCIIKNLLGVRESILPRLLSRSELDNLLYGNFC